MATLAQGLRHGRRVVQLLSVALALAISNLAIAEESSTDNPDRTTASGSPSPEAPQPRAAEVPPSTDAPQAPKTEGPPSAVDATHKSMSKMLESVLRRTDSLFTGDRTFDAPTGSYILLGASLTSRREYDGGSYGLLISRAKINLPKTNEKVKLLIDRDIDNVDRSASDRAAAVAAGQTPADNSTVVALRGMVRDTMRIRLTADAGVRPRGLSPDPFVRGRAERIFTAGAWQVPLSETLLFRRSEGFSAATKLGLLRSLRPDTVLGLYSTATWRDNTSAFDVSQVANITRRIDQDSLASVEMGVYGNTGPNWRATAYSMALRYRRRLHRDWLLLELRPQLIYPESTGFRPVPSLTVQLEVYFGESEFPLQ